ncbi:MAG: hypothetical protein GY803_17665 [Chloroflexi bacterium]|nr:hypothetical protein [Chloroflexota bacterium]
MEEKSKIRRSLRRVMAELKEIALVASFGTLALWINMSLSIFWIAASYIGFIFMIILIYTIMDFSENSEENKPSSE